MKDLIIERDENILKHIVKLRWLIIPLVLIAAVLIKMMAPDYSELLLEKGSAQIPDSYSVSQAKEILTHFNNTTSSENESMNIGVIGEGLNILKVVSTSSGDLKVR